MKNGRKHSEVVWTRTCIMPGCIIPIPGIIPLPEPIDAFDLVEELDLLGFCRATGAGTTCVDGRDRDSELLLLLLNATGFAF